MMQMILIKLKVELMFVKYVFQVLSVAIDGRLLRISFAQPDVNDDEAISG
jgi:hypothetical protein